MPLCVGDKIRFERIFAGEDVKSFTQVSGDSGNHHVTPDEQGRLMVQGLLTATLPTKIGGDYNVLARTMHFEFVRPVFTGDAICCEVTIAKLEKQENRTWIETSFTCTNQNGKIVMQGTFTGVILD